MKLELIHGMERVGLGLFVPLVRLATWDDPREQLAELSRSVGVPLVAILVFGLGWSALAASVETSIGALPGPKAVWTEVHNLVDDHREQRAKEAAFDARMGVLEQEYAAEGKPWKDRRYSGRPTYFDQVVTSLKTVFAGFVVASLVAVPLGILCGLSPRFYDAVNPLIQIFKPVSPLAWLPIVMILVSALYTVDDPLFAKSFVSSAVTVALCSLWPTLANTALGVAAVDRDHLNVARVLKLSWPATVFKIVIPSALPLIFAGLRMSLAVGWMVLIAAEMLAQNPGLGKFVWDMFQNGSSATLAQIMVAVFTIGIIGFMLDRVMLTLQGLVSFGNEATG